MSARHRTVVAVCALLFALPAPALASQTERSIMIDDNHIAYTTPQKAARTLEAMAALGVDIVKVAVNWKNLSPHPNSFRRPRFDAGNPAAYPPGTWTQYDTIDRVGHALGMDVYFQVAPPAPNWAVSASHTTQGRAWSHYPNLRDWGEFVHALGERYSGSYGGSASDPSAPLLNLPIPIPGLTGSPPPPTAPLPRVDMWGVWNEPNEAPWLNPQFRFAGGRMILTAPSLYRGIVFAAWKSLTATGHAHDTVLIGETASYGWIRPIQFVEALYCVSSSIQPLSGDAAAAVNCPRSGDAAKFAAGNPGLFHTSGYAHHPYSFDIPPSAAPQRHDQIDLSRLGLLERTLDRIFRRYGMQPAGGVPIYLTEWGYKSNPPNPYVHTSLDQQAAWVNQGEFMTYFDPRVRTLAQFLYYDDKPRPQYPRGSYQYWGTFQTGLLFADGKRKPLYYAYRIPVWLPSPRHGPTVTVWGQLRPAHHSGTQYATVRFQPRGAHSFQNLTVLQTDNREGFFLNHITIPSAGLLKVAWLDPSSGKVYYSRTVTIN